jgi:hypothetical protein
VWIRGCYRVNSWKNPEVKKSRATVPLKGLSHRFKPGLKWYAWKEHIRGKIGWLKKFSVYSFDFTTNFYKTMPPRGIDRKCLIYMWRQRIGQEGLLVSYCLTASSRGFFLFTCPIKHLETEWKLHSASFLFNLGISQSFSYGHQAFAKNFTMSHQYPF